MTRSSVLVTSPPRLERRGDGRLTVIAATSDGSELWFAVDEAHAELVSDRADAFAVGLLLPAMRYERDLHLGGVVTDVLLHRLNHEVQSLVRELHPNYATVAVSAEEVKPAEPAARGVATGFSGGVDSLAVLAEYALASDIPPELRITHLLSNNVGAFGDGGRQLWRARYEALRPIADELGLPFVRVDSNLEQHFRRMGFVETHTLRNAAVAHLLSRGIGRMYYASAVAFRDAGLASGATSGSVDAFALPLLSTPAMVLESANPDLTRVEKTIALATNPYRTHVDVCIDPDPARAGNCSRCWKCVRTMFTLEVAGMLGEFTPKPFRLEPYLAERASFQAELLASDGPLMREVVRFAEGRGWRWSVGTRARAALLRSQRRARETARGAKRALVAHRRPRPSDVADRASDA